MSSYERGPQFSFQGVATFMRSPARDFSDLQPGQIAVAGAPLDTTTIWKQGARGGPRAIREASLHVVYWLQADPDGALVDLESGNQVRSDTPWPIVDLGDLNVYPNQVEKTAESFRLGVREIVTRGAFPLILGGDHYISLPCCQGAAEALAAAGRGPIGYLQFGCELGLGEEHPHWGREWSGMQARRLAELGVVQPRNLAWVGPSGLAPREEVEWARQHDATLLTAEEARRLGPAEATRRALDAAAKGCAGVYVSLGLDALDSSQAPGVGATVIGGLHPVELAEAVQTLAADERVVALDVVEVAPNLDPGGRTARLASNFILDFLAPRIFS